MPNQNQNQNGIFQIQNTLCNFVLLVLMTQFGKTFVAISKIITELKHDALLAAKSIHLIFTMNTLLNNEQFALRLTAIETQYGKGSVCIVSSRYKGNFNHVKNLNELIGLTVRGDSCPRIVVMCSNKRRYDDGVEFLKFLNKPNPTNIKRAFAYYDELHKYINNGRGKLRNQIEEIHSLNIIHSITAMTATPEAIFENYGLWSTIQLKYLKDYSDTNYAGCRDMIFNIYDDYFDENPYIRPQLFDYDTKDRQTVGFIIHVLDRENILIDSAFVFLPVHLRRNGHNEVRKIIFKRRKDSVVVLINGVEKCLQFYDDSGNLKTLPLLGMSPSEEVCETISTLIKEHNLVGRPLVITGYICVGMGQTLINEKTGPFTSAIISHLDVTNDDLAQLFGRVTGRTKQWRTYKPTQIYCPTTTMNRVSCMEECARNMAAAHNGEKVTLDTYKEPMNNMPIGYSCIDNIRTTDKKPRKEKVDPNDYERGFLVGSQEEMLIEAKKMTPRSNKMSIPKTKNKQGFYMISGPSCQAGSKKPYSVEELRRHALHGSIGSHLDKPVKELKEGEYSKRRYWCYNDLNDPDTLTCCLISVKKL